MADYTKYTKQEMQAYAIAKNIKENQKNSEVNAPPELKRVYFCAHRGSAEHQFYSLGIV